MRAISSTQIYADGDPEKVVSIHPDDDGMVTVIATTEAFVARTTEPRAIRLQFTPAEAQALSAALDLAAHIADNEA